MDGYTLHVGPVGLGTGGTNPISVPPTSPGEYEFIWFDDSSEWCFGLVPGSFWGRRFHPAPWSYLGLGGGVVLDRGGMAPGVYSSLGVDLKLADKLYFNAEAKQAIGVLNSLHFPYAIRIGITWR